MTHFLLIRHAETDMAGRFCGHSDPELNERGRRQLAGLVNTLSEYAIQRVYTSDLRRALQTAGAIAEHFEAELRVRPGLREIHFGQWEGLSWNEIEMRDPAFAKSWVAAYPNVTAPGGESFQQACVDNDAGEALRGLCQEDAKASCCTKDEGRSFGAAL